MRRTLVVLIMVVAIVVGVVAYASAAAENVVVTARVNPAFSMSINQNAVNFGTPGAEINLGSTYSDNSTGITVKSNKLWDFTKTDVVDPLLTPILTESTDVAAGVGKAKGVTNITATYDLDLTADNAYDLDPMTDYQATYTYTAVQQ